MLTFEQHQAIAELYKTIKDQKHSLIKAQMLLDKKYGKGMVSQLNTKGLIEKTINRITLTKQGLEIGFQTLRTIAVLKVFCQEILALSQKEADEHIEKIFFSINKYLLEKYCSLIGHASRGIPAGTCCKRAQLETSEQVISLSKLPINTAATILYVKSYTQPTMRKLFDLGLYPGKIVKIIQLYPAYIILVEQEEVALEPGVTEFIFVKK